METEFGIELLESLKSASYVKPYYRAEIFDSLCDDLRLDEVGMVKSFFHKVFKERYELDGKLKMLVDVAIGAEDKDGVMSALYRYMGMDYVIKAKRRLKVALDDDELDYLVSLLPKK